MVKQQRAKYRIIHLKNAQGDRMDNFREIENILLNHFKKSYDDSVPGSFESILEEINNLTLPQLSDQHCVFLHRPRSNEEIEHTVFQIGANKAPGSDGFPAFFYQEFWNIIKPDVLKAVHAFFHSGPLLTSLNHTYITLIPKVPFPDEVNQF